MTQSNEIKNLLAALVEVQSELPTMPKDAMAGNGSYGYKYADLDTITQTIKPILKNHKIGYMQSVGSDAQQRTKNEKNKHRNAGGGAGI